MTAIADDFHGYFPMLPCLKGAYRLGEVSPSSTPGSEQRYYKKPARSPIRRKTV